VTQEQTHPDKDAPDIAITLHHSTLPKLAETELLDYDPRSKTARYRGHTEAESAYLPGQDAYCSTAFSKAYLAMKSHEYRC
jgi:hypothetical protein